MRWTSRQPHICRTFFCAASLEILSSCSAALLVSEAGAATGSEGALCVSFRVKLLTFRLDFSAPPTAGSTGCIRLLTLPAVANNVCIVRRAGMARKGMLPVAGPRTGRAMARAQRWLKGTKCRGAQLEASTETGLAIPSARTSLDLIWLHPLMPPAANRRHYIVPARPSS